MTRVEKELYNGKNYVMKECRPIYEGLDDFGKLAADYAFQRLEQVGLRNLGPMSNAELAVKLIAFMTEN